MAGKSLLNIKKLGVPNMLSIFRLILIPVFVVTYITDSRNSGIIAAVILIVSGISDVLDGIIARKFNMISALGRILDPLADKLTQAAICICLIIRSKIGYIAFWILLLLILKEFVMIGAGANIIRKGKEMMSSKWFGKLATAVSYSTMTLIIAFQPGRRVVDLLLCVVLGLMIFSFIMYIPFFFDIVSKRGQKS